MEGGPDRPRRNDGHPTTDRGRDRRRHLGHGRPGPRIRTKSRVRRPEPTLRREYRMTAKELILRAFEATRAQAKMFLADLSDADLLVRPVPGANHIAWQFGHVLCSE